MARGQCVQGLLVLAAQAQKGALMFGTQLVDSLGQNGKVVGAINAARRKDDDTWEGDMFDGLGCVNGLQKQGHSVAGKSVFLMGTGGAGAAIASAMAQAGMAPARI